MAEERSVLLDGEIAGLYASAPEPLGFAPGVNIRAFGLRRDRGSLVVYSARGLGAGDSMLAELGGASRQYLSHWHEAGFLSHTLSPPLVVHENECAAVARHREVAQTFGERHTLDDDFEVIPIPGHTSGATAYLWSAPDHRVLFSGDTIILDDGEWAGVVLDESDRDAYVASLEVIRELDFDVLVPWATRGPAYGAVDDPSDARRRLDGLIGRVRRGENR